MRRRSDVYSSSERDLLVKRAACAVHRATKRGLIPKAATLTCVDCGSPAKQYDHRDYRRPLDVVPVCRSCNIRRGPGLPEISETDGSWRKRQNTDSMPNVGKKWRELDSNTLVKPTYLPEGGAVLTGSGAEWLHVPNDRLQFGFERYGNSRDEFFKKHDPWYEPNPADIDWAS